MPFDIITPPNAPPALAPYSSATRVGDTVYVSGILALDAQGKTVGLGDVRSQTRHVLNQIAAILAAAGGGLTDVAFNHIFLRDLADYGAMNEVYREFFGNKLPARYCIRADMVRPEFLVEITAIAGIQRSHDNRRRKTRDPRTIAPPDANAAGPRQMPILQSV